MQYPLGLLLSWLCRDIGAAQRDLYDVFFNSRVLPHRLGKKSCNFLPPDYWFLSDYFRTRVAHKKLVDEIVAPDSAIQMAIQNELKVGPSTLDVVTKSAENSASENNPENNIQEQNRNEHARVMGGLLANVKKFLAPLVNSAFPWTTPLSILAMGHAQPKLSRENWRPLLSCYSYARILEALRLEANRSVVALHSVKFFRKALLSLVQSASAEERVQNSDSVNKGEAQMHAFMLSLRSDMLLAQTKDETAELVWGRSRLLAWEFVLDFIKTKCNPDGESSGEESSDSESADGGQSLLYDILECFSTSSARVTSCFVGEWPRIILECRVLL